MEGETCLIITGGNLNLDFAEQFLKHRSYGCVIAVDGGLEAAAALGVCPDEIVGDLDTVNPALFDSYRRKPGIRRTQSWPFSQQGERAFMRYTCWAL